MYIGELLALLAALLGGISAVAYRRAFSRPGIEPEAGVTTYLAILTAIFLPYVLVTGVPTSPSILIPFVAGGLIGLVGGGLCYFSSIRWIGAARAVPIRSSAPVFAPVFAALFLGQASTLPVLLGTILVVFGAVLIVYETRSNATVAIDQKTLIAGIASSVAAAALFALYPIILRMGYDAGGTPFQATGIAGTSSFLLVLILGQFISAYDPRPFHVGDRRELLGGSVALSLAITVYLIAFSLAPVVVVIVIYGSLPLFSALFSYLFLKDLEKVTPFVVLGSILVVAGITFAIAG